MAIIRGRQMGLDMPTLAKQFKTSKSVIWATLNTPNLSKATGRPLKTSIGDDRIIFRMSKKDPRLTSTDINSELKDQYEVQVFKDTVKRRLSHALRFRRRPVNKPMIPEKNRSARLNDESKYLMIGTDGVTLVRRPGGKRNDPKYQVPTVKHGGGNVMMWSCFHANGLGSLFRITGTMESYMYKDIMEKEMIPSGRSQMGRGWLFQQDNDPKHSSHFFKDWFAQRREVLGRRLKNKTAKKLYREVRATQGRMDQDPTSDPDEFDRVHAKRCEAVIKAKGMATKY
uniref:HTH_Tnp_Tc3_2 domain-containing protein n=1 Tax=Caenorhabditis japonica TaxID=281687 RepID=A0A8R1IAJ7_CAEJA